MNIPIDEHSMFKYGIGYTILSLPIIHSELLIYHVHT